MNELNSMKSILNFNQNLYFQNEEKEIFQKFREKIINDFESMDTTIKNSEERKQNGWVIHGTRTRHIKTIGGDIVFTRTRYKNKDTKEVKTLLDDCIGIGPHTRTLTNLDNEVLNKVDSGGRYKDIADSLKYSEISEATICNIVKRLKIKQETIDDLASDKIDVSNKNYIYLNTDDTFMSLMEKSQKEDFRTRLLVAHTGVKKGFWNRNYLENKKVDFNLVKIGTSISTAEYAQQIKKFLSCWYKNVENKQIILLGDAAKWIPNLAEHLGAQYVLDKFHLIKRLGEVFPFKSRYKTPETIFYKNMFLWIKFWIRIAGSFERLLKICDKVMKHLENKKVDSKMTDFNSFISYMKNNKVGIENYYKDFNSSCHTEGQISWFVKSTLGYGKKIYSFKNFQNILTIKKLKANGQDLKSLLEYDIETIQIGNNQYNFEEVKSYKSFGSLCHDKKTDEVIKGGIARKVKQPGYKHNSY